MLLERVGQLVCKQSLTVGRAWLEFAAPKKDIPPESEGPSAQRAGKRIGLRIFMHPHPAELVPKARLEEVASWLSQGLPTAGKGIDASLRWCSDCGGKTRQLVCCKRLFMLCRLPINRAGEGQRLGLHHLLRFFVRWLPLRLRLRHAHDLFGNGVSFALKLVAGRANSQLGLKEGRGFQL